MERVNRILNNKKYRQYANIICKAEENRVFCRHDIKHSLDVARIALILSYEEGLKIHKSVLYAAALLHDIGRAVQGEDHRSLGAELAESILEESGFSSEETALIKDIIENHGNSLTAEEKSLKGIFYRADKLSRLCFDCNAYKDCFWSDDKKNMNILV